MTRRMAVRSGLAVVLLSVCAWRFSGARESRGVVVSVAHAEACGGEAAVSVVVRAGGGVVVDGVNEAIGDERLGRRLAEALRQKVAPLVVVMAEPGVEFGVVARVIDEAGRLDGQVALVGSEGRGCYGVRLPVLDWNGAEPGVRVEAVPWWKVWW